ncbi:MAG: plasmid stabilization protein [Rhizobium sp.]
MASMTIRDIDDQLTARLPMRAAAHGRSMEDETRDILRAALSVEDKRPSNLAETIRRRMAASGGVTLDIPAREPIRPIGLDP